MLIVFNVLGCFLPDVVAEEALDITHAEELDLLMSGSAIE